MGHTRPFSVLALVVGLSAALTSSAAPSDGQEQIALTRNATSEQSLSGQLSKKEFRYVEREESYIEQVPYDVDVPYEEDETYSENENRCEDVARTRQACHDEQSCSDVPHTRQECHDEQSCENVSHTRQACHDEQSCDNVTHYRQECRNEESCNNVTHYRQSCHNEESCSNVPRESCHSENVCTRDRGREVCHAENRCSTSYERECSSHQTCENEPYSERECSTQQVCSNEPYSERECSNKPVCHDESYSERECGNKPVCHDVSFSEHECHVQPVCHDEHYTENVCQIVAVPHTRRVTKHKTVTRYRPEQRVRTVTDAIFDHAWGPAVVIVMPPEAALVGNETESIIVQLAGTEASPDANVTIDSPVFSYRVADKRLSGNTLTITMALVAKYAAGDLGTQTVTGLALVNAGDGRFEVRFTDAGQAARVATAYHVTVLDRSTNTTVFETRQLGAIGIRDVAIAVTGSVAAADDHVVTLEVAREGIVLAAPIAFTQTAEQLAQLDPAVFTDVNGVREFAVSGVGSSAALVFTDAGSNLAVHSVYDLTIQEKFWGVLWERTVAHGVFERSELTADGTKLTLPLASFRGLTSRKLDGLFGKGRRFVVKAVIKRVSDRLAGHSPIMIRKQADLRVASPGRSGD